MGNKNYNKDGGTVNYHLKKNNSHQESILSSFFPFLFILGFSDDTSPRKINNELTQGKAKANLVNLGLYLKNPQQWS